MNPERRTLLMMVQIQRTNFAVFMMWQSYQIKGDNSFQESCGRMKQNKRLLPAVQAASEACHGSAGASREEHRAHQDQEVQPKLWHQSVISFTFSLLSGRLSWLSEDWNSHIEDPLGSNKCHSVGRFISQRGERLNWTWGSLLITRRARRNYSKVIWH